MNSLILHRAVLAYVGLALVAGTLNCMDHSGLSIPSNEVVKVPLHSLFFDWELIYEESFNYSGYKTAISLDRTTVIIIDSKGKVAIDTDHKNGSFAESFHDAIEDIALSAQGAVALISNSTKAQFWSTALNEPLGEAFLVQPPFSITARALSSNGTFAVIAFCEAQPSSKGYVQLWEKETGKRVNLPCSGNVEPITSLAISAKEETVILGQKTGPTLLFYIPTQKLAMLNKVNEVGHTTCVALSPQGDYALAAYTEYDWCSKITVWDTKAEEELATFAVGRGSFISSVEFSSDGYSLLVVSNNGDLQVFDTLEGICLKKLISNSIYGIEWAGFSSGDQQIIASTINGKHFVWEVSREDTSWQTRRKKATQAFLLKTVWNIALERELEKKT